MCIYIYIYIYIYNYVYNRCVTVALNVWIDLCVYALCMCIYIYIFIYIYTLVSHKPKKGNSHVYHNVRNKILYLQLVTSQACMWIECIRIYVEYLPCASFLRYRYMYIHIRIYVCTVGSLFKTLGFYEKHEFWLKLYKTPTPAWLSSHV